MKKLLCLLLALIMVLSLTACGDEKVADEGEKSEFEKLFDDQEEETETVTRLQRTGHYTDGSWSQDNIDILDEEGRVLRSTTTSVEGEGDTVIYTYDKAGNMVKAEHYYDDELQYGYIYTYDKENRMISMVSMDETYVRYRTYHEDGSYTEVSKGYDYNGELLEESTETWDAYDNWTYTSNGLGDSGENAHRNSEVEIDGNVTTVTITDQYDRVTTQVYTYDENGNLLSRVQTYGRGEEAILEEETTYIYDEENRMVRMEHVRYWDGVEISTFQSFVNAWSYDENGRLVEESYEDLEGFGYVITYTYEYVEVPVE